MSYAESRSHARTTNAPELPGKSAGGLGPGKQTLVEQAYASVQQRANTGNGDAGAVHAAASRGTATSSSQLPYSDVIQRAFGRHDISSVQAHTGSDAAASARDMGADAYATGNHVVLGKGNDLATVAHEAAHVVQQRGGVQLKGGVGQEGDPHERHADEVAARVVQGKSAEDLLDRYSGGHAGGTASSASGPGTGLTQLKLSVGGANEVNVEVVWARIGQDPRFQGIEDQAKALLKQWIENAVAYDDQSQVSSNRKYANDDLLIRGLVGDIKAAGNLAQEGQLAKQTISEGHVDSVLAGIIEKLQTYQQQTPPKSSGREGRYGDWRYPKAPMGEAVQAAPKKTAPQNLHARIAIIADYALAVKGDFSKADWNFQMGAEHGEARGGHWNTNEAAPWVQEAREQNMPLSAGPSATTAQVLALADVLGCSVEEKTALAWALFTLWNDMPLHVAGTHRFHEVMDVAVLHGVPYEKFQYGAPPKRPGGEPEADTKSGCCVIQ